MKQRIQAIQQLLARHEIDAILLTHLPHIRWAVGFTGSNGLLYVDSDQATFVTDGRYATQAGEEVKGAAVVIGQLNPLPSVKKLAANTKRLGFDAGNVTFEQHQGLETELKGVELAPISALLQAEIAAKSADEIRKMQAAQRITDQVFAEILEFIQPNMTEKAIAAEIVYRQLLAGAEAVAFEPIVAAGPNGAKPHAIPSDRKLESSDLLVLDFGCTVEGYCSDMTRTIAIGPPPDEARTVYQLVLKAQEAALALAKAGVDGVTLDRAAREIIKAGGHDIPHSLGHGLGLELHEWPSLRWTPTPLPAGCSITIEPGVYLPGRFGVRIEDIVVLRAAGADNLTHSPKDLIIL